LQTSKNPVRVSVVSWILIAAVAAFICTTDFGFEFHGSGDRDYLQYWTAEQLLVHGNNPYDIAATFKTERAAGLYRDSPLITLSPPVAFVLAYPLGWVSAGAGLVLWLLVSFACTLVSVWLLWILEGRPNNYYHLVGLIFPPVLWCFMAGQIGVFFLLDVVLFLYLHKRRPYWAGAALVLCSLKPQLFVPCLLVLVLWSLRKRSFRILAGFFTALAVSCLLTLCIDRQIWTQYAQLVRQLRVMNVFLPTVSVGLRFLLNRNAHWIEFIPEAIACTWAAWYFWSRRDRWDWMNEGLLLLAVSVAFTPYSFYTDQAVLVPAVVAGLRASEKSARALLFFIVIAGLGLVSIVSIIRLASLFYLWTAPAWLVWYLYARHCGKSAGYLPEIAAPPAST
jgi:hypothetical protein